jgi:hypothetical protein
VDGGGTMKDLSLTGFAIAAAPVLQDDTRPESHAASAAMWTTSMLWMGPCVRCALASVCFPSRQAGTLRAAHHPAQRAG